ncbi:hypothetical protein FLX56_27010, partial [Synechococcus moorigangaii CMS01]|nr:hypothetical protein [Synechococcus moorigangaii CMS01]
MIDNQERQSPKHQKQWIISSVLGCLLLIIVLCLYTNAKGDWTKEEVREWTIGLLFPGTVGVVGYFLNQAAEERAKAAQEQQENEAKAEKDLREKLAKQERQDQREQANLQYYFDRIST